MPFPGTATGYGPLLDARAGYVHAFGATAEWDGEVLPSWRYVLMATP